MLTCFYHVRDTVFRRFLSLLTGERKSPEGGIAYCLGGMELKTLRDVPIGGTATVVKLQGEGAVRRRIMDMGITKGVEIYVRKVAPLGDPVEITVRGYELSVRKADAEKIEVE